MADDDAEVIKLFQTADDPEVVDAMKLIRQDDYPKSRLCSHHIAYDLDAGTVECTRCGKSFLPIDALDYLAREWERRTSRITRLRESMVDVDELAKEERRIKARLRRAKQRITEAEEPEAVRVLEEKNEQLEKLVTSLRRSIKRLTESRR